MALDKQERLVISCIHTFLLLHTKKQDCGTEDIDDADDPGSNQVRLFLRAEEATIAHVKAVWNSWKNPHWSATMQKIRETHRLIQCNTGHVDCGWVIAIRLCGTICGATNYLSLDCGAQNCAQHLHHHTWEQHRNGASAHKQQHAHINHLIPRERWRTISSGRVPLFLVIADEHGEGWIWYMEALQTYTNTQLGWCNMGHQEQSSGECRCDILTVCIDWKRQ